MRAILIAFSTATILACSSQSLSGPSTAASLVGVIKSRAPGQMLVDGTPEGASVDDPCLEEYFIVDASTKVFRGRQPADTSDLIVGKRVSVWSDSIVVETCPASSGAVTVVIEN